VSGEQAAAVGTNALTVERSAIPSCADGWKREGQSRIVVHARRGAGVNAPGLASTFESCAVSTNYATLASLIKSAS